MMLGLRERFAYFECGACGCLQIEELPINLQKYYPEDYYSLKVPGLLKRLRGDTKTWGMAALQRVSGGRIGRGNRPNFVPDTLPSSTSVLEIGCGRGYLVADVFRGGFSRSHGIDPFMAKKSERTAPFRLERASADNLVARNERYGFVYMSHSLEHMPDQQAALASVRQLLTDDGICCLRIPWVSSDAWEQYRENWVQLDAPRHFYLHSKQSLEHLVSAAGLRINKLWCDSDAFQFWGSEQYQRDIPLYSSLSWLVDRRRSPFTADQIEAFGACATALNSKLRGDQVVAWLSPIS
jgi:SAM-dependent methyltransferase